MIFSFGYGYVAQFLGGMGTSRLQHGPGQFSYLGGALPSDILDVLQTVEGVLISIPPVENEDLVVSAFKECLPSLRHLKWVGYLSSTSVYGDHQGHWVTETSPTHPLSPHGTARLMAEQQWLGLDLPIHIFRLAGIYGPGRNALEELKSGKAKRIYKEGIVFSRIHVLDIVQVLKASVKSPNPGRIYNVADNLPAPSYEVIGYGAKLLGMTPPPLIPFEEADLTPMGKSFYQESKRVCNKRILSELIPSLIFPTYKEGLKREALAV